MIGRARIALSVKMQQLSVHTLNDLRPYLPKTPPFLNKNTLTTKVFKQ